MSYMDSNPAYLDYSNASGKEWLKRVLKYVLEGLVVAIAAKFIPSRGSNWYGLQSWEVVGIAIVAAVTFAILDIASPSIGMAARQGAGLALGVRAAGVNLGPYQAQYYPPAQPAAMPMPMAM